MSKKYKRGDAILKMTVYNNSEIRLKDMIVREYKAKNREKFSLEELVDIIKRFESENRPKTDWFGEIDRTHRYFEGLQENHDGTYTPRWASI